MYADLLAAAKVNPETVNFKELRLAYVQSPQYAPYTHDEETRTLLNQALSEENMEMAINLVERLLESYYLDIDAHMIAAVVYGKIGDETKLSYHRKFVKGLLDSIFQSGDGRTFQTAFVVIDVDEEYAVLRILGIQPTMQSLHTFEGHQFDVFQFRNLQTGQTAEIYFNIDFPKGWLDRNPEVAIPRMLKSAETYAKQRKKWWQFWK